MKKILILISSLISALVLFLCISFNTSVFAYDVDSESSYSKSVTLEYQNLSSIFELSTGSYVVDDVTHYSLKFTNITGSSQSRTDFLRFGVNETLISCPYVLLLNYSTNANLQSSMYRGVSGSISSQSYTLTYSNSLCKSSYC